MRFVARWCCVIVLVHINDAQDVESEHGRWSLPVAFRCPLFLFAWWMVNSGARKGAASCSIVPGMMPVVNAYAVGRV